MKQKGIQVKIEIKKFNKDVDGFLKRQQLRDIPTFIRKLGFEFLANVMPLTPVDTGRARGGWYQAMTGSGSDGAMTEITTQDSFTLQIVNRVIYIVRLEFGHSKIQAPHGFVRITLKKMADALKGR